MQFKVPQDVQREDTIIFNITIKQLVICLIGGGFAYAIYIGLSNRGLPAPIWFPPVLVISALTLSIAFLKINELTFTRYILLFIERLINPQKRMWKQGAAEVYRGMFAAQGVEQKKKLEKSAQEIEAMASRQKTLQHISRLSEVLDKPRFGENHIESHPLDEAHDDALIHEAFGTGKSSETIQEHRERLRTIRPQSTSEKTLPKETNAQPMVKPAPKALKPVKPVKTMEPVKTVKTGKVQKTESTPVPQKQKAGEISLSGSSGTIEISKS